MRRIKLNFVILALILIGVARLKGRMEPRPEEITARTPAAVPTLLSAAAKMKAASVKPALPVAAQAVAKPEQPFAKELAEYAVLEKKVFLTPFEEATRKEFLASEKILRSLRLRLVHAPINPKEAIEQNAAIDLLLEAVRAGNTEVAVDVLRAVVEDGQIEDETVDRATRENLAGVKAEVLYHWSALKPTEARELANLLPGPVSQKIWQNVVNAHAANLSESAALAH